MTTASSSAWVGSHNAYPSPPQPHHTLPPKALHRMIIHDPGGLHPRIHNHRPHKLEPALLQLLRHPLRQLRRRRNRPTPQLATPLVPRILNRPPTHHPPNPLRKPLTLTLHRAINLRPGNGRLNLRPRPHNPLIL